MRMSKFSGKRETVKEIVWNAIAVKNLDGWEDGRLFLIDMKIDIIVELKIKTVFNW